MQITDYFLKPTQYFAQSTPKKQIVLHHTASSDNARNVIDYWNQAPERIATAFVIDRGGRIFRAFDEKYWAYHLGISSAGLPKGWAAWAKYNTPRRKDTIGIELTNWGGLTLKNGSYLNYVNSEVPEKDVVDYGKFIRGYRFYQNYTDAQIGALKLLLVDLCSRFKIPKTYYPEMWECSKAALEGAPGIWTHVSYRTDKSDLSPYPKLINMLENL